VNENEKKRKGKNYDCVGSQWFDDHGDERC